ncbi:MULTISPECIES: NAD(P)/FAD-dependent oxidoreductase [unclassified Polaromonas]|uniref:NAD(P)/FAD-dependent oxidoreductase n=1 Tax=unclassified Polaromonas TaxID=2638319 RepID=UPI000F08505A|nr:MULTISPECIES: NAD(P)/FAD-dependent oxidoreductase [unclassified Polaromonas]AYQ27868.1 NAD(P)/FAD-dependent oxidoreductase [Polaromonas sp. SP1]QGJ17272.1 FAD-binding protein [Polaromonas sp. Pch-P]
MLHDAIIVGGSFAGLSAALQLARARRNVLVIDAGLPRNRFASESHGVLGHDGKPGPQLLAEARQQLLAYPTAKVFNGRVSRVQSGEAGFVVEAEDGLRWFTGRRLLLATGVSDVLPEIPGLRERWGQTVIHCPYCHGYEIGGGAVGVLGTGPMSVHQAMMFADWGEVTLFTQGVVEVSAEEQAQLAARKVRVEASPIAELQGAAPAMDGALLQDGRRVAIKALLVGTQVRMASPLAEALGCAFDDSPFGPIVRIDAWGTTSVDGVYAAGDMARVPHSITFATASGVAAGIRLHSSLITEDAQRGETAAA